MYSVQHIFCPNVFKDDHLGHQLEFDIFLVMTICKCPPKVFERTKE